MRIVMGSLLALLVILCVPTAGLCGGLTFYTANVPPYTYTDESGRFTGLSVDLDRAILDMAGMPVNDADIRHINWARAYQTVLTTPNTALFSLARTPVREGLFKWVGPLAVIPIGLIARKSSKLTVDRNTDLSRYRIAVVRGSAPSDEVQRLYGLSSSQLAKVSNAASQIRMLEAGRVDMIAQSEILAFTVIQELGFDLEEYEMVHVLVRDDLYMALNRDVDDKVVDKLQSCLDTLRKTEANGKSRYCEIVGKYSLDGRLDLSAR
ncbi:transporter substrate-binding domain-containing protein [uncultured Pseudodesulfovibrio sp.]|uniref:substrate-binding periplasmic protein n=1 Tax=uncultured Pseudodesulfovibrio sp. TaxID=2035858 RepID=UPI0029C7424C|nr:transporter substrate-binding domain-containing protein [uncultured Pseudodesulfovibrio sp.]